MKLKHKPVLEIATAGVVGLVFGLGLVVSGMSNPAKVLGFLDIAGRWDPSLALVMAGAIAVGAVGFALARKRPASALGLPIQLPSGGVIDRPLVLGAAVFGVGWGLVGLCPGPALAALSTGSREAIVFVAAMFGGMFLFEVGRPRTPTAKVCACPDEKPFPPESPKTSST